MSIAMIKQVQMVQGSPPKLKLWTVDEFHDLGASGILEGRRPHLVDGVILEEGPMNPPHATVMQKLPFIMFAIFGSSWVYRGQLPLPLGQSIDPMPDFAVVPVTIFTISSHPTTADLVIEVSDTTLAYDTTKKMSLYAAGGIADYWVLDLKYNQLIIHRDPQPDATQTHGHGYTNVQIIPATGIVSPLAMPSANLKVQDMLP